MSEDRGIFYNWKWTDLSPENGRDIKWEFNVPYVLAASGSLFRSGFSFHIWLLCFGVDFITDVGCGKVFRVRPWKYYISFILRRGWSLEFHVGIDRIRISDWKVRRMMKNATFEERLAVIDRLRSLLPDDVA